MKNSFRIIAVLLAVLLISVMFCSCEWLDEKKASRAVYSDDYMEITYQDNVYRLILAGNYSFIADYDYGWNSPYVTTKDVPLLLTDSFGDSMSVMNNGTVLSIYAELNKYSEDFRKKEDEPGRAYGSVYYVRSDKYDELKDAVDNAVLDHYYFEYWDYNDAEYSDVMLNDYRSVDGGYRSVLLDDKITDIVNNALKASADEKVSFRELSTGDYDLKAFVFAPCDKNMIITQSGVRYYLVEDHDKYYFWDGNYINDAAFYPFGADDAALLKALFENYPDAVNYEDILYQFNNTYADDSDDIDRPIDDLRY